MITATYSPEDNKLRLYASERLDEETYAEVKKVGFRWAPKQELFVCPAWTPQAEDLALKLAGEIGDEDTSLLERAEERSIRFDDYSEKRAREASQAADHAEQLASAIPMGQPILVGHHSERKARRDQQKIESSMKKAISLFETSTYWESRAQRVIKAAKYKDAPRVRARRIKTLEADRRKWVRSFTPANPNETILQTRWNAPDADPVPHVYMGKGNGWEAVEDLPKLEAQAKRWIAHLDRRLSYERALLEAQGATSLLDPPKRPKKPPIKNISGETVCVQNFWRKGETEELPIVEMTKAEYAKIYRDYKGTRLSADGTYRIRIVVRRSEYTAVFLTDAKAHEAAA